MGERQTVTELYRECEVNCAGAKGSLVSCVKYRGVLNYEFNLQFLKPNLWEYKKHDWKRENVERN